MAKDLYMDPERLALVVIGRQGGIVSMPAGRRGGPERGHMPGDHVVRKRHRGALFGAALDAELRAGKIDTAGLCGVSRRDGLATTARRQAYGRGCQPPWAEDACSARRSDHGRTHAAAGVRNCGRPPLRGGDPGGSSRPERAMRDRLTRGAAWLPRPTLSLTRRAVALVLRPS